jgi:hypothetical protein
MVLAKPVKDRDPIDQFVRSLQFHADKLIGTLESAYYLATLLLAQSLFGACRLQTLKRLPPKFGRRCLFMESNLVDSQV